MDWEARCKEAHEEIKLLKKDCWFLQQLLKQSNDMLNWMYERFGLDKE